MARCIYCGRYFNASSGQGDHVLPSRLFGEFEGAPVFRGICVGCNNSLGRNEQLLAQATPLGLYRWVVNPNLGNRKERGGLRQRGAHGSAAPTFTMLLDGWWVLVEPSTANPLDTTLLDQIVLRDGNGNDHQVRVFPNMTSEQFEKRLKTTGLSTVSEILVHCDPQLNKTVSALIHARFPKLGEIRWELDSGGDRRLKGQVRYQFSGEYFQAVAKIAFHYYLCWNQRGLKGDEPMFRPFATSSGMADHRSHFFMHLNVSFLPLLE